MSFKPFPVPPKTYRITQLSREFGVTSRALRHYEDMGLLSPIRRDGERIYSRKDRARLILVLRGRAVGIPLEEIGHMLDLYDSGGRRAQTERALSTFTQQIRRLETERDEAERRIAALRAAIESLSTEQSLPNPSNAGRPRMRAPAALAQMASR